MPLTFSKELINTEIAATLTLLCERYPIATTWLIGAQVDDDTPAPVALPSARKVLIPSDQVESLSSDCKNGLSQITAHEFGHVLMLASQLEASGGDFTKIASYDLADLKEFWEARGAEWRSEHIYNPDSEVGRIVRQAKDQGLSLDGYWDWPGTNRARHDDLELFAECMRAYWVREPDDDPLAPIAEFIGKAVDAIYRNPDVD